MNVFDGVLVSAPNNNCFRKKKEKEKKIKQKTKTQSFIASPH